MENQPAAEHDETKDREGGDFVYEAEGIVMAHDQIIRDTHVPCQGQQCPNVKDEKLNSYFRGLTGFGGSVTSAT